MMLADWLDQKSAAARLAASGMSADCAANAATCFAKSAAAFQSNGYAPSTPIIACWAPGRIEVLGKHTDYCGGDSILAAVERGFCLLAAPRGDGEVTVIDAQHNPNELRLDRDATPRLGHWSNYPHTVVRRVAKNFPQARQGATIAFTSNLPPSSGLSSSSAFVVGTFLLLSHMNDLKRSPEYTAAIHTADELAGYLGTVENGGSFGALAGDHGVGTFGGSEDHTAILCGRAGGLVQYGYCPVRFRREIQIADEYVFAVASSGVIAEKTGSALVKYNRVSKLATAMVDAWRAATHGGPTSLAAIVNASPDASEKLVQVLNGGAAVSFSRAELIERLDHFLTESRLIASVPDAIDATTSLEFGRIVQSSQEAGVRLLKNQTPETIRLAELARDLGGFAASAFGAGFGGSVWALVPRSAATSFLTNWQANYTGDFPEPARRSEFFLTRPGVPAFVTD